MPADKASGLDDFSGQFYRTAWSVIKDDVMHAFHTLWAMDFHSFYLVNQPYTILLRKSVAAEEIKDYQPISFLHSSSKLVTKVLAIRVGPLMH
jgi:hypothetical protein